MTRKCVHLATKLPSFRSARESIAETIEVPLTTKRVERLTERIGETRVHQREFAIRLWERSPLMEKLAAPPGVKPPPAACVSCDGGRMQRCDLPEQAKSHWCESKVGILLELESSRHEQDPCPELPDTFRDLAKMNTLTREIHRAAAERADPRGQVFEPPEEESPEHAPPPDPIAEARAAVVFDPPGLESCDVVASLAKSDRFGQQLAARAWSLGFAAAAVKSFVADGQSTNWGIWEQHFKHLGFVPILDFIHALTYVYSAATADRSSAEGGPIYVRWMTWVWEGDLSQVIAEVAARSAELGPPGEGTSPTDPRSIVASTLKYLVNQQSRMNYPEYRRHGLPITSSHIESTVKQINGRVQGSEKFWTAAGGESLLQLRADQLSDTNPLSAFWIQRSRHATGTRNYSRAA